MKTFFILTIFLAISAYANFRSVNIFDPDSFYHIRHAWLYRVNGIFDSSFPWLQYSVVNSLGSDLWYGFHIFLIPFTYIADLTWAIKIAGLVITFLVLTACYITFKKLAIKFPAFWSIIFIFSSSKVLWRMIMTRPHPLSLVLTALIFGFFYSGSAWLVLLFSFLISWIHSAVFWFPIIAIAPLVLFKALNNQKIDLTKVAALLGGIVIGLLARPNPLANLKLIYIQVIDLYLTKNRELADMIGLELGPPIWENWADNILIISFIFICSLIYLFWSVYRRKGFGTEHKIIILSAIIMCFFSILMYVTAKRAIDLLAFFVITLGAVVATYFFKEAEKDPSNTMKYQLLILMFLLFNISTYTSLTEIETGYKNYSLPPTTFKEPALWLKENTKKGEIVFNLAWPHFPPLFFWNQHNYYIYGMDPIFLYKYDKKLYWKMYYMFIEDMGGLTCGVEKCGPEDIEMVYDVLRKDFKASYVLMATSGQTRFLQYLEADKEHYKKVYELEYSAIFKVLPENRPVP